jgi:hypothetical protein
MKIEQNKIHFMKSGAKIKKLTKFTFIKSIAKLSKTKINIMLYFKFFI